MLKKIYGVGEQPNEFIGERVEISCPKCQMVFWFGVMFGGIKTMSETDKKDARERIINKLTAKAQETLNESCPNHKREFEY